MYLPAQGAQQMLRRLSVRRQAVLVLERLDCGFRARAEIAVDFAVVIAEFLQPVLQLDFSLMSSEPSGRGQRCCMPA